MRKPVPIRSGSITSANERAQIRGSSDEKERLFAALENFANMGDDVEDYRAFGRKWPSMFPVKFADDEAGQPPPWCDECHALATEYRNYLREVWKLDRETAQFDNYLSILFALHGGGVRVVERGVKDTISEQITLWVEAWRKIGAVYPLAQTRSNPIFPNWAERTFEFLARNDFQRAVFLLFRESWRARNCIECGAYFIAEKAARMYCRPACSARAKQERDMEFWNRIGSAKRKARSKANRKNPLKKTRSAKTRRGKPPRG